jgi:hypothetical protein
MKTLADNQAKILQLKEAYRIKGHYLSEPTLLYLIENQLVVNGAERHVSFPLESTELIEGVHYYVESGKWVFTELYHLLRGYCCKSGCRHCVYGPIKNP